jgi:anthranilate synthase component 2|tara:strand:+ start:4040 stop:4627 length:588 start_codon:yes stop_codon:yes gene_type:complete
MQWSNILKKILLIDNYDSFTYNLYHCVSSFDKNVEVKRNDKVNCKDIIKNRYKKIIISPGPGTPNQSGNCLKIVKDFYNKLPILGVCLGHQIIGQVFGSKIIQAKKLMHGKTSLIKNKKLGVLKGIKNKFYATRYHSLIVDRATLSKDLIITATTEDNIIMGLMHKKYQIHGVQFHPESINTKVGMKIIKNFVKI